MNHVDRSLSASIANLLDMATPISIATAALVRDGRVLLVHRHPLLAAYPDRWDLAGGHVETGEHSVQALRRECREELGVDIEEFVPFDVRVNAPHIAVSSFLVTRWWGKPENTEPDEHDDLAWFSAEEITGPTLAHPKSRADLQAAAGWQP